MNPPILFEYKRNGNESGFMAQDLTEFVFKPDKYSSAIIPVEILRKNLRVLVKTKKAQLIKLGTIEAVAVPSELLNNLFFI